MTENSCPLTGHPCSHNKHIHITDVGDNVTSLSLCDVCAGSYLDPKKPVNLIQKHGKILLELLIQLFHAALPKPTPPGCPNCGMTLAEINTTGRLGCGICYSHYQLEDVLKHAHGSIKHVGKVPKNRQEIVAPAMIEEQIRRLEEKLASLIKDEHYEIAAQLRDAIKVLKEKLL